MFSCTYYLEGTLALVETLFIEKHFSFGSCYQKAKENFELALEADNSNTHARYWLAKLHFKYHVPGANKAV